MAKTYTLDCPENCSLRPGSRVGILVTEWMLEGRTYKWIIGEVWERAEYKLNLSVMTRHKAHITVTGRIEDPDPQAVKDNYKANNIEILETIIQKGFQNAKNWKPTISDTMKAMDMWFRLTQGNPFDDLLDTLASAAIGEAVEGEDEEAVSAEGERPDVTDVVADAEVELVELAG